MGLSEVDLLSAQQVIEDLQLSPLGFEGGCFSEVYRSALVFNRVNLPSSYGGTRSACTAIYYLLEAEKRASMHRLRSDELYHFYLGDPVEILILHPDGSSERAILGSDLARGQRPFLAVPGGSWQGARLREGGNYALMGTTVSPGFEVDDFELGSADKLIEQYPAHETLIAALCASLLSTPDLELTPITPELRIAEARGHRELGKGINARVPENWPPEGYDQSGDCGGQAFAWYIIQRRGRRLVGVARDSAEAPDVLWKGIGGDIDALNRQVQTALASRAARSREPRFGQS